MNLDDLTIGDAKQIAKMFPQSTPVPTTQNAVLASSELCIVVADRGWVWVGKTYQRNDVIVIDQARCVRRWGTSEGLGQLANDGPQPETKLERSATVLVPIGSIVAIIPCEAKSWK